MNPLATIAFILVFFFTLDHSAFSQAFFKQSNYSTTRVNILDMHEWPDRSILTLNVYGDNVTQQNSLRQCLIRLSSSGDTLNVKDWFTHDGDTLFSRSISEGPQGHVLLNSYSFGDDSLYIVELDTNLSVIKKVATHKGNGYLPASLNIIRLSHGNYVQLTENFSGGNMPLIQVAFMDSNFRLIRLRQLLYRTEVGSMAYDPVNQRIYVNQTAFFDSLVYYNYYTKPALVVYDTNFVQLKTFPNQPAWTFDSGFPVNTRKYNTNPIVVNSQNVLIASVNVFFSTRNWVDFESEIDLAVFNYNLSADSLNMRSRISTPNEYDVVFSNYSTLSTVPSGDVYLGGTTRSGRFVMPGFWYYDGDQWVTITKLNSNLQIIWTKQFKLPNEGMFLGTLVGSIDNGVLFAGSSRNSNGQDFSTFIGKTDLWGGVVANVAADRLSTARVEAFPNPAEHQLSWQAENPMEGTMTIRDLQGKAIWEASISLPHTAAIHHFAAGLYTWHFISNDGKQASGKWVKR